MENFPNSRAKQGKGICRACANFLVKPDLSNSLTVTHPIIASEFNVEKNQISPTEITAAGNSRYWWKCEKCEHEWETKVDHRVRLGSGCPCCTNQVIHSDGRNSLSNINPKLAKEWHPTKNGKKTPDDVVEGTGIRIWWVCSTCTHEWRTRAAQRVKGTGCPACAGKAVHMDGRNSFENLLPELVIEWHPTKNENITPATTLVGSSKRVWWVCDCCEHEWKTKVSHRTGIGSDCPACANLAIHIHGLNSIAYTRPDLALQWHPTKNGKRTPENTVAGTGKRIWWLCQDCDKEWKVSGSSRTSKSGTGCPSCAKTGFDPTEPAVYYCMEISGIDGVWWYKGGITADIVRRRESIQGSLNRNNFPLQVKVVSILNFDYGGYARELETKLLRIKDIRIKTVEKFDGSFELFNINPAQYAIVLCWIYVE
jgi:Zn finger protein HypA/HybF involved in hydrogenase expression